MCWGRITRCLFLILCLSLALSLFNKQIIFAAADLGSMSKQAEALTKQKKYADALGLYETLLTQNPGNVPAYRGVVKCYNGLGDSQGALIFIEALFLDYPERAEVNYGLGYALFNTQKYKEAAHYFDQAIALKPNLAEAWNNRAAIYQFVEKDAAKARQFYEKAIELAGQTGNQRVIEIAKENLSHIPKEEILTPVTTSLTLEQFLNRFVTAVEEQDDKAIRELVMGQQLNCELAMDWLLEEALKASVQGQKDEENKALLLAKLLDKSYGKAFDDPTLKEKKESFDQFSKEDRHLLVKSEALLEEGLALEQKNAFSEAAARYNEALAGFKKLNRKENIGITYAYIGDIYSKMQQYDSAQRAYVKALPYFDQATNLEYKARLLASLGQACFKAENFNCALDNMEQSLKIYRQLKNESAAQQLKKNIATTKEKLRD